MRTLLPIALLLTLAAACTPTCEQVCRKARTCGVAERLAQDECELSCNSQDDLLGDWEDEELETAFDEHKRCVTSSTCEEIAAGVCYDERLFSF